LGWLFIEESPERSQFGIRQTSATRYDFAVMTACDAELCLLEHSDEISPSWNMTDC